jgi:signal transduction histidine kinase
VLHRLDPLHGIAQAITGHILSTANGGLLAECEGWFQVDADHRPTTHAPLLMVRSVRVADDAMPIDLFADGSLELPYDRNAIAIAFGTVALLEGAAFTHAYRLSVDDVDGPWNDLGRQRSLNLLNLAPGTYRVELRAEGPSSRPVATALRFVILPPWWSTWWARLGFIILAALVVVLVTRQVLATRYRQRLQKLEREREVERVRMRIARDIHDGIGSGLTKITILSRQLDASAGEQAERIAAASTDLVNELGEIVWTVDPRNDSYSSFVAFVRNTLGKQFDDSTIELTSTLHHAAGDAECTIGPEVKRNVLLVLKEAVNNTLKHSGATQVNVILYLDRDRLHLVVTDNGQGFDPEKVREGANGLLNFRRRAEAIGGHFDLRTGPSGTTITLDVPIPSTNM